MIFLKKKKIFMECKGGAFLEDCLREATFLAVEEKLQIEFTHNLVTYTIDPPIITKSEEEKK